MLLVLGKEYDPHCDLVTKELQSQNANYARLNIEDLFDRCDFVATEDDSKNDYITLLGRKISASEIKLVYRRGFDTSGIKVYDDEELNRFFRAELEAALYGFFYANDTPWFNHPLAVEVAAHKINQLKRAGEIGFQLPKTLISNKPDKVRHFIQSQRSSVQKVLNLSRLYESGDTARLSFTRKIGEKELADEERVTVLPSIYQEYIEKKSEIRVTVIGETVIAIEILSQVTPDTVDWRSEDVSKIPHRIHELPEVHAERCRKLVKSFGLSYGAIDLILTPDGKYVFLELNPEGLWGWQEVLTTVRITKILVNELLRKANQEV